jgi:hypothetical protein
MEEYLRRMGGRLRRLDEQLKAAKSPRGRRRQRGKQGKGVDHRRLALALRASVNRRVAYVSRHDGKAVESL